MLSLDLDRRLPPRRGEGLARHLSTCDACARAAVALGATWARLDALPLPAAAPDDFAAILARVDERATGWRGALGGWVPWRLAAAVLAMCVVVGSGAGLALGSAAFGRVRHPAPVELAALAEGFGDLPFGSPAAGLARALTRDAEVRE